MREMHTKYNIQNAFKFNSNLLISRSITNSNSTTTNSQISLTTSSKNEQSTNTSKYDKINIKNNHIEISSTFADRYIAEVATIEKLKDYEKFALKHKKELLAESKQLSEKFGDEMKEAVRIEDTVNNIFHMLTEFAIILQNQSEIVEVVHDSSKVATEHVNDTDEQLIQTIEKTKSFQRNLVIVIVGMSLFLLLLDALTP
jgi:hypothetical protein